MCITLCIRKRLLCGTMTVPKTLKEEYKLATARSLRRQSWQPFGKTRISNSIWRSRYWERVYSQYYVCRRREETWTKQNRFEADPGIRKPTVGFSGYARSCYQRGNTRKNRQANAVSLRTIIKSIKPKRFGHVTRMHDGQLLKMVTFGIVDGRRPRGRPSRTSTTSTQANQTYINYNVFRTPLHVS